jgi:DNA-binding MarR family transcriptional regulator
MTREDLRTLRLLEAVAASEKPTQRKLARALNISLGLVNASMKRLAKEGYVEVSTTRGSRVRYHLNSRGVQEKTRLTHQYIRSLIGFYRDIKALLQALFSRLETEGVKRLALYGCGEVAELAYLVLHNTGIALVGVFDDGGDGVEFYGHRVQGREALNTATFDYVLLTQTEDPTGHHERLIEAGVQPGRILDLKDEVA